MSTNYSSRHEGLLRLTSILYQYHIRTGRSRTNLTWRRRRNEAYEEVSWWHEMQTREGQLQFHRGNRGSRAHIRSPVHNQHSPRRVLRKCTSGFRDRHREGEHLCNCQLGTSSRRAKPQLVLRLHITRTTRSYSHGGLLKRTICHPPTSRRSKPLAIIFSAYFPPGLPKLVCRGQRLPHSQGFLLHRGC